jgi:hypothetical protein
MIIYPRYMGSFRLGKIEQRGQRRCCTLLWQLDSVIGSNNLPFNLFLQKSVLHKKIRRRGVARKEGAPKTSPPATSVPRTAKGGGDKRAVRERSPPPSKVERIQLSEILRSVAWARVGVKKTGSVPSS